ncbi:glyoxalase superfamily protein [Streptomyces sp. DSM 44915]|uniref:Glyoxalase superfamily protein n=1 Tax=Streptomyces chisholmiae TaxID=3075540 RepID=A0ABU2JJE7_9ACTN|nr:glyoxalase superfamily protein [Streptomyces sp. DSM 44915]MDT0265109.1 glyoxalase superfamily protein [Streptomyces sp. DSM 44915]
MSRRVAVEEAIPVLWVREVAAVLGWYLRLGFGLRWEHRFEPGLPVFAELGRGPLRLFLSEHEGDARPGGLVYLRLADLDAVAEEFGVPVRAEPWGRELELTDPAGNRLRISDPQDDQAV